LSVPVNFGFGAVGQRSNQYVSAVIAAQLGRHRLESCAKEHVEKKRFYYIFAVMAKGNFCYAALRCEGVQAASTKP